MQLHKILATYYTTTNIPCKTIEQLIEVLKPDRPFDKKKMG